MINMSNNAKITYIFHIRYIFFENNGSIQCLLKQKKTKFSKT